MFVSSAAPQPQAAAAALLFAVGMACFALVRRVCRRPRRRESLRRCPLCTSAAVGVLEYEIIDGQVRVLQECGQCGVWREVVTALAAVARHERKLETDRIQILRCAERLKRDRALVEMEGFVTALRDAVVGAEDLLGLISADTSERTDQNR